MAASDGKVIIDTQLNNKGFNKGIKGMKGQLGGLTNMVGKLGKMLASAFAVKAIVDFGKECIELGSDVQEVQNVVDTAFGDMAYKAEAFASTAITQFGMSSLAAKKTASNYMAMAKGMGVAEEAASDMSVSLAGLTGDVASFYNLDQEEAAQKLAGVFTGEGEALKSIGVVMTETNLQAYALSQGITKQMKDMTQAEKVALRYGFVTNALGLAQGDFAKTADSWANQTRILSMQWQEFMSVIGQALITILRPLVTILNIIVGDLIKMANALNSFITYLFGGTSTEIEQTKENAAAVGGAISDAVDNQDALTDATKETAKAQKAMVASFDEINKLSSGSSSGSAADDGGITGGLSPEFAGLVKKLESDAPETAVSEKFEKIAKIVEAIGVGLLTWKLSQALLTGLNKILGLAGKTISPNIVANLSFAIAGTAITSQNISKILAGDIKAASGESFIAELTGGLGLGLAAGGAGLTAAGVPIVATVALAVALVVGITEVIANWDLVKDMVSAEWEGIKKIFTGDWEGAEISFTEAFMKWMSMDSWSIEFAKWLVGDDNWEAARKALEEGRVTVFDGVKAIRDDVTGFFSDIWDKISGFFGKLGNKFNEDIEFLKTGFVPNLKTALNPIKWLFGDLDTNAHGSLNAIIDHINGFIEKVAGLDLTGAATPFKDFTNGLIERFEAFANRLISGINALITKLNSFKLSIPSVPFLGIEAQTFGFNLKTLQTISIPRLAQGAVIPPNREFMAVLGDQKSGTNIETPLATMVQAFKQALAESGGGGAQTIVLQIDGREFGRAVKKYGGREDQRIGVSLVGVKG